ncbi:P-loop containing nucleoside triphosphate hydrolase protein [Artomyces pyxidatus]|uniref:P-loop containing nucleoside triphosphate hydrolase protein n=1 Tax=Artomyces pyxidatus TaxID=48021 RepID=A0ACB8TGK8_9AGAM|nr:P-loop containing nucleoside triphosphate hydrolase protein [Artomyces pyxidatus]
MELDDFEDIHGDVSTELQTRLRVSMSATDALDFIDREWYRGVAKRGRWMDLIGDYAGSERFILDGESLLQQVLDDPMLALGREKEPSFQILHARHCLERFLDEIMKRFAVFDLVFWENNRHLTLKGDSDFVVASRALARALLFSHLLEHAKTTGLTMYTFEGLSDPKWLAYQRKTRPMFVMLNDGGGSAGENTSETQSCLVQRRFIFDLLSGGVAVSLLRGAEFRDMKIFAFIFEQRFGLDTKDQFPPSLWNAVEEAEAALESDSSSRRQSEDVARLRAAPVSHIDLDSTLKVLVPRVMSSRPFRLYPLCELLYIYVAHCLVLPALSVAERARPLDFLCSDLNKALKSFLPPVFYATEALVLTSNIFLDLDGRVFTSLIRFFISHVPAVALQDVVGPEIHARLEAIWQSAGGPTPDLHRLAESFPNSGQSQAVVTAHNPLYALLPFQNDVFESELATVRVAVAEDDLDPAPNLEFSQGTVFSDTNHWHDHHRPILPKHLGGGDAKPSSAWLRQKMLRNEQFFMRNMQQLAATLTGASGRALQQIRVLPMGRNVSQLQDPPKDVRKGGRGRQTPAVAQKQPGHKGKAVPLSGAEKIRQKNAEEKQAKGDSTSRDWWQEQLANLSKLGLEQRVAQLAPLFRNPRSSVGWLAVEMRLFQLDLEIRRWLAETQLATSSVRDRYVVAVMRQIKDMYEMSSLTPTTCAALASVLVSLGFSDYIASMESAAATRMAPDRPLSFTFVKLLQTKGRKPIHEAMHIKEDPIVWQLRLFGEYMDRSMDSSWDARVSFQPDAWQRDVLDCLDSPSCSVLVVAPTSAGKTFISFYAMEKVLRESDDGILVYVAPTKALVNQVAAEVYARFSKDVDGRTCWAIHTRDYRVHDPQKCQILVTVPEMLAIMLLSPPLAKTWTPRIRRIILDEIHTIGQQEGGSVWEQILLLAPCPIIGLSATVGAPDEFNSWLESVQKAKGFDHKYINHPHRYSHLRKFCYFPQLLPKRTPFEGLDQARPSDMMRFMHPVSSLGFGATSVPPDLSLEASDVLHLYEALRSAGANVDHLDPAKFFSSPSLLRQKDVLCYETALKDVLLSFFASSDVLDHNSPFRKLLSDPRIQDPLIAGANERTLNTPPTRAAFLSGLIPLLADLHVGGNLPALLFSLDRGNCEVMAQAIVLTLQRTEGRWRKTSNEWRRKVDAWEEWKARESDRKRLAEKVKKARKQDMDSDGPSQREDRSWESSFDPKDPSSQFSFAGTSAYSRAELAADIDTLRRRTSLAKDKGEWVFEALRRGIGVHHSGMARQYRSLVERLFRLGFLRVVIATGTLALGINAPTKTSVFCGDSPYLTALTYRQCAGRAGRRGYDLLGRVVFYGLPMDRIHRLVLSRLPSLSGTFPLSSTLVLRLFNLLDGSGNAPYAEKAIQSILRLPRISFGSDVGQDQLLHHLRFSIEYLRRSSLLNRDGRPINLFGMASHIYHTEPSNFALVVLLQSGVVHDICLQPSLIDAQRDFMALMCHLFGRRYLPDVYATAKNVRVLVQKGPSRVILPPMHAQALGVLLEHQAEIMRIFTAYTLEFSAQHAAELGPDNVLPLSMETFAGASAERDDVSPQLHRFMHDTAIHPIARSLFVANSGHGDHFEDIAELATTVRHGFHLNAHAIPSLERITAQIDSAIKPFALNAYLFDFYVHGQVDALANANGIRRGDVWYLLQDFHLTLTAVQWDLEKMLLQVQREATETEGSEIEDAVYDEEQPDEVDSTQGPDAFKRLLGVSERDWQVYKVVSGVTAEFGEKFKAMWAR